MKRIFTFFCIFCTIHLSSAQKAGDTGQLLLKDGSVIVGTIVFVSEYGDITIRRSNGMELTFDKKFKRIFYNSDIKGEIVAGTKIPGKGNIFVQAYFGINFQASIGTGFKIEYSPLQIGANFMYVTSPYFYMGMGVERSTLVFSPYKIYPVYLNAEWHPLIKRSSPYFGLKAGGIFQGGYFRYTVNARDDYYNGLFLESYFGIQIHSHIKVKLRFDCGINKYSFNFGADGAQSLFSNRAKFFNIFIRTGLAF